VDYINRAVSLFKDEEMSVGPIPSRMSPMVSRRSLKD